MNVKCSSCGAYIWLDEKTGGTIAQPKFSMCCNEGKVCLTNRLNPPPEPLRWLLTGQDQRSKEFRDNIRAYNSVLAFASIGVQVNGNHYTMAFLMPLMLAHYLLIFASLTMSWPMGGKAFTLSVSMVHCTIELPAQ